MFHFRVVVPVNDTLNGGQDDTRVVEFCHRVIGVLGHAGIIRIRRGLFCKCIHCTFDEYGEALLA